MIKVVRNNPRIQPHFHIPLQSGSDSVLRRMNRKYKIKNFRERIEALFAAQKNVSIGTDVIVGYPGETEEEFQQTYDLLEELPINYFHVFPYSPRPGTKANTPVDDVTPEIKKQRVRILRTLSQKNAFEFFGLFQGHSQKVLVEKRRDENGMLCGITPHYVPVRFEGGDRLMECEIDVELTEIRKNKKTKII
ncbi:MAG: radical SAM protein [Bdellovibrionota bacterium]